MKLNLVNAVLAVAFVAGSSPTLAQFQCPDPPAQVGENVDRKEVEGDIAASVAKVFNAPVGSVDVKGALRTLSEKMVKDYPGVNEGTALLTIGSVCCQIISQLQDPEKQVRLYTRLWPFWDSRRARLPLG